jgi:hypothetical protein
VVLRAIAELAGFVRPSGDDLVFGLDHDLGRVPTLDQGWQRLCETAWALGFVELRLTPDAAVAPGVSPRQATVPGGGAVASSWAFEIVLEGRPAGVVTARRGANGLEFEPARFVEAVQVLVARFARPVAAD